MRIGATFTAPRASPRWPLSNAALSRLAAGAEPTLIGRCRSRARVCCADSGLGLVFSRSRQWSSRAQPRTLSLAHQCQVHGALCVIALAVSQRDYVASRRGTEPTIVGRRRSRTRVCRADCRRSHARLSRRLGSCDLTVAPVGVSRAATGAVAFTSVPRARRLAHPRAGHEPTRLCPVSPQGVS